jgi:prolyl oligopeptidase
MQARRIVWVLLALAGLPLSAAAGPGRPAYPPTRKDDVVMAMHGEKIPDPYRWLEKDDDPEVVAWDQAQYALLRKRLDACPGRSELQARLKAEFASGGMRSLPIFEGGWRWTTYRPQGADQPVLYRAREGGGGTPQVVLDPNTWSKDGTASILDWQASPDGRYVAFRRGDRGSEETTLFIWDTQKEERLPEAIDRTKFATILWDLDSKGFLYNRMPDPHSVPAGQEQYHDRIYHHRLGDLVLDDPMVYGRGRPMLEGCWMYRSADRKQLFVGRGLPYKSVETFEAAWEGDHLKLTPVVAGRDERTWVDKAGDTYVFNTDRNTGRREVFTAQRKADGTMGPWQPVEVPRSDKGVIQDAQIVGDRFLVVHVRDDLVSHLWVRPLAGGSVREIPLPGDGTVGSTLATKLGDTHLWFSFDSYTRPPTIYRCDTASKDLSLVAETTLPTTVDTDALVCERTTYPSKDGTRIPIFLLHRKDQPLDGSRPTVLYGYGGFRVGLYPHFARTRALWADLGGVLAVACLRGGNEYGEAWHQAGCLANKQNVFDDFEAGADWLVSTGRASRERLALQGGSNGGLLVAVCVNQRPDACRAAVAEVPLTDMLRYQRFQYARSWTKEYGDPDVPAEFAWIRPWSPYHNVKDGTAYPAVLLTGGIQDSRVDAFHARKMAARWQAATSSDAPILLRIDRKGGHGAAGLTRALAEVLDVWCFLREELAPQKK